MQTADILLLSVSLLVALVATWAMRRSKRAAGDDPDHRETTRHRPGSPHETP